MSALDLHRSNLDDELGVLLEAFGSVLSLEAIASAYCQAKKNVVKAGEILCEMQRNICGATNVSKDAMEGANASASAMYSGSVVWKTNHEERNPKASKPKKCSVSMGTVSSVIGKDYIKSSMRTNEPSEATKPLKLTSEEVPISEIWSEEDSHSVGAGNGSVHRDLEEFLFNMLGEGFQLDKNVIREVLGLCGYNVKKSMEKLLDLSASTLEKNDDIDGLTSLKPTWKSPSMESHSRQEKSQHKDSTRSVGNIHKTGSKMESPKTDKDRYNLQREVLDALFNVTERFEEVPRTQPVTKVRGRTFGPVVAEPLRDTATEHAIVTAEPLEVTDSESEDDEDSYHVLRQSVKEYWTLMKEYYRAAVDSFVNGNHEKASKLLEQGNFYCQKAREADEKSAQKLLETKQGIKEEVVSLDMLDLEPKEAIRLLRLHLVSLSGIPAIEYINVIVGSKDEDAKTRARKRVIIRQLERESIKWTEEENGRAVRIRVDEINPKKLSFAKKQ